jgi:RNA recognition motif-containing protein
MIIKITEKIVEDLFVIGINDEISEDDLIKTFSVYGEVVYSKIIKNKFAQKTKGIAFIKFKERKSAFGSMADNGKIFCKGYPLKIKYNIKSKENKYFKDENRFKENLINKKKQANYVKVIVKEVMR